MSTGADTPEEDDDRSLDEICESIVENDDISEDVRYIASGLLESIENGDLDVR